MSSPPILDLGIAGGGAAGSLRPMRQQAAVAVDQIEDTAIARISTVLADSGRALAAEVASNVIELDSPQLWRGQFGRTLGSARQRINPQAVALSVRLADAFVLVGAGGLAYGLQSTLDQPFDVTTGLAALATASMAVRLSAHS